jgi:hypothetical protein
MGLSHVLKLVAAKWQAEGPKTKVEPSICKPIESAVKYGHILLTFRYIK